MPLCSWWDGWHRPEMGRGKNTGMMLLAEANGFFRRDHVPAGAFEIWRPNWPAFV